MATDSMRVQAKLKEGITEVKMLIKHPMETGARKEQATGKLIPAHFIQEVTCEYEGKVVMSAIWSGGVSKDPYCAFKFKGGKADEKVKISWKDNKGEADVAEVKIKAG